VVVEGSDAGQLPAGALDDATKIKQLEGLFLFAIVWSTGATCDTAGRIKFDKFLRYLHTEQAAERLWTCSCSRTQSLSHTSAMSHTSEMQVQAWHLDAQNLHWLEAML
jgi:hypothetical protein